MAKLGSGTVAESELAILFSSDETIGNCQIAKLYPDAGGRNPGESYRLRPKGATGGRTCWFSSYRASIRLPGPEKRGVSADSPPGRKSLVTSRYFLQQPPLSFLFGTDEPPWNLKISSLGKKAA